MEIGRGAPIQNDAPFAAHVAATLACGQLFIFAKLGVIGVELFGDLPIAGEFGRFLRGACLVESFVFFLTLCECGFACFALGDFFRRFRFIVLCLRIVGDRCAVRAGRFTPAGWK